MEALSLGYFGDVRRQKTGEVLLRRVLSKNKLTIKKVASSRSEQVRFQRFLWSNDVTAEELKTSCFKKTGASVKSRRILAIQDSSELNFNHRRNDIEGLGVVTNGTAIGLFIHPVLAVDAEDDYVYGLCGLKMWSLEKNRKKKTKHEMNSFPLEQKKTYRWVEAGREAKSYLSDAAHVTLISDRESDFYDLFDRLPDEKTAVLVRCRCNRKIKIEQEIGELYDAIEELPIVARKTIDLEAKYPRSKVSSLTKKIKGDIDQREKRSAELNLRFSKVVLCKPQSSSSQRQTLEIYVVEVREILSAKQIEEGLEPIHWRLLTSHAVEDIETAWTIVDFYKKRWHIEQLFRAAKRGGMQLEEIQASQANVIKKMCIIGLIATARILQLTICREGKINRPITNEFDRTEIEVLKKLKQKYEGKTEKQKNPHPACTIAWAHWIIARLGGWKGYTGSEGPAGPATLKYGLDQLVLISEGFRLSKNVCIT